ncbi:MAG: hypothetical protein FWD05_03505 [Oscillospiraceae bacterium]|nr:hypothetical protein [Oscillospiraceae bacterium]
MFNSRDKKTHVFTTTHQRDEINDELSMPRRNRVNNRRGGRRVNEYRKPNGFISAFLNLCAIFFICVFISLLVVRTANVPQIIRQTDFVGILEVIAVGEHSYYIVDQINALPFHNAHVDLYDIDAFIRTEAVSNEIGNILGLYAAAFADGNLDYHITANDVVYVTRNLNPELQELFHHNMTESDHDALARRLDDIMDFNSISVAGLMYDFDIGTTIPSAFLSSTLLWVFGLISASFLLIIFLLRIRSFPDAFLAVGIPITISGLIIFVIGLFIGTAPALFGYTIQRILGFLDGPAQLITQYGLRFAIAGGAVIALSLVLKIVSNTRYRRHA